MKKAKKQKLISRIICAIILPLLILINSGAAQVAYAAPKKATPAATPDADAGVTCEAGWKQSTDKQFCTTTDADKITNSTCPDKFHRINYLTKDDILYCGKDTAALSPELSKDLEKNIGVIGSIQSFLNRLIWPVLVMIGGLMENDLLFGNGMEEKLRDIWIPIRNLVNILFVIILVGLALYNVLGLSEDSTSIKALLPKIIIGIIAVNFSFVGIKVVLDGINMLTTAIFALPTQVSEGLGKIESTPAMTNRLCASLEGFKPVDFNATSDENLKQAQEFATYHAVADKLMNADGTKMLTVKSTDSIQTIKDKIDTLPDDQKAKFNKEITASKNSALCDGKGLNQQGRIFLDHYNSRNAAFALALNMGNVVFYSDVDPKITSLTKDPVEKIFTNALFSMILYIVYCVSFLALFIVLMGRLAVMWVSIAISPILLLMIPSTPLKDKLGGIGKISEQFTKNAIAPLLIALPLTVGWIMLKALQGLDLGTAATNSVLTLNPTSGLPVAGFNTLQDFIVAVGVIGVVWTGVFAAADGTIAHSLIDKMKGAVTSAGSWLGALPFKHIPMIPINLPGHPHKAYTLSSLGNFMHRIGDSNEKDQELYNDITSKKSSNPEDLKKSHSKQELYGILKDASEQGKLGNKDWRKEIHDWRNNRANNDAFAKIKGEDPKLAAAIETLAGIKPSTDKEVQDAIDTIKRNGRINAATTPDTTKKPDAKAKTPAAPGAKPYVTGAEKFDKKDGKDRTLGEALKLEEDSTRLDALRGRKTELNDAVAKKDGAKIKTAVQAMVKVIYDQDPNAKLGDDQLKVILGDQYDTVKKKLGTDFANAIKKQPTPTAGTGGTGPATGGPAAAAGNPPKPAAPPPKAGP
ncbi:hypothetical protein HZA40_03100 [Candidatus Peregrinibacteria bacterium]|nr:hypothetical protein [Candidatus Peregrinibacteria bacterium]